MFVYVEVKSEQSEFYNYLRNKPFRKGKQISVRVAECSMRPSTLRRDQWKRKYNHLLPRDFKTGQVVTVFPYRIHDMKVKVSRTNIFAIIVTQA